MRGTKAFSSVFPFSFFCFEGDLPLGDHPLSSFSFFLLLLIFEL
jgi:hypothetical protein